MQRSPWVQAAFPPQRQLPIAEHASAAFGSHDAHAAPARAQVLSDRVMHWPPLQQPFGQVAAEQPGVPASIVPASIAGPSIGISGGSTIFPSVIETHSWNFSSQRDSVGHCASDVQRA